MTLSDSKPRLVSTKTSPRAPTKTSSPWIYASGGGLLVAPTKAPQLLIFMLILPYAKITYVWTITDSDGLTAGLSRDGDQHALRDQYSDKDHHHQWRRLHVRYHTVGSPASRRRRYAVMLTQPTHRVHNTYISSDPPRARIIAPHRSYIMTGLVSCCVCCRIIQESSAKYTVSITLLSRGLCRRAVSVRPSVTFVHSVESNKHIYNFFIGQIAIFDRCLALTSITAGPSRVVNISTA